MDLMSLVARLSLDSSEYEQGLGNAEDRAKKSTLGSTLKTVGKMAAAGLAAATTAVVGLTTSAVQSYSEFQQLEGGIETLFGDAAPQVMKNASDAFKTAGMSMNDYMETSITSAASLLNSLGGDQAKAADLMDMSIQDMADNVNKMGTSMEAVQNAYRGFSRGNFTMLDNLALGFAGTKQGMEELLAKAIEIKASQGEVANYSIDSYADMVEAIHVVQEEMGITGTTAPEAAGTISGSFGSLRSAWDNLITGLADGNADIEQLISNVANSALGVANNILPIIKQALSGVGKLIGQIGPLVNDVVAMFVSELPDFVKAGASLLSSIVQGLVENLPVILDAVTEVVTFLINSLSENMPAIVGAMVEIMTTLASSMIENAPVFIDALLVLLQSIGEAMLTNLPVLLDSVSNLVQGLVSFFTENLPLFIQVAVQIITSLAQGLINAIPDVIAAIGQIVNGIITNLTTNLPVLLQMGVQLIASLAKGFVDNLPAIVAAITEVINAVVDFLLGDGLMDMLIMGVELIMSLAEGLIQALPDIVQAMVDILANLIQRIVENLPTFIEKGVELVVALITGLMDALPDIIQAIIDILTTLVEYIINNLPMFLEAGIQIILSLAQALIDNAPQVLEAMLTLVESLITLIIDNLGEFVSQGLEILISIGKGIVEAIPELLAKAGEAIKGLWEAFVNTDWGEVGGNIIDGITSGISGAVSRLWNAAVNAAKTALSKIKNVLGIASPSKVFRDEVGEMIPEGMAVGIEANTDAVKTAMDDLADITTDPFADMSNVIPFNDSANGAVGGRSVVINVYPREGQDEESIAEYVMEKLNLEYQREERALA